MRADGVAFRAVAVGVFQEAELPLLVAHFAILVLAPLTLTPSSGHEQVVPKESVDPRSLPYRQHPGGGACVRFPGRAIVASVPN